MDDFIFGTLATEEKRLERVRALRAGVTHNFNRAPHTPRPGQQVKIALTVGPDHPCDRAAVYWTDDGSDPIGHDGIAIHGSVSPMVLVKTEWDTLLWGYVAHYCAVLPAFQDKTLVRYCIAAHIPGKGEVWADEGRMHAFFVDETDPPAWAQEAIIYQIFSERFYPGGGRQWHTPARLTGFYGGTLAGVAEKLDYIADLGVNTIWFTPIFPTPSHHGYDALDFFEIEPRLGSKDEFKQLLEKAHARSIRILLDFVPNHISNQHPIFQDAARNAESKYRHWFSFRQWPHDYETFFGVKSLPQLNLRNPEARQYVLEAARYWLEFGVDGYRVDYAIGPSPDFWAAFHQVTRGAKADCWTFGEIVDPPDVQLSFEGGLDGALDFNLLEALRQAFAFGRWDALRLASFLDRHEAYFPPTFTRPSFLDNHDMNRFLWAAGNDKRRLKLAAVCQFTLAGPPVIYYGTEVGMSQQRDVRQGERGFPEESRLPMVWDEDQDQELLGFYRALTELRRSFRVLQSGTRRTLLAQENVLVYIRENDSDRLMVALNLADSHAALPIDGHLKALVASDNGCELVQQDDKTLLELPGLSAVVAKYSG